jgi:hypothetical protein
VIAQVTGGNPVFIQATPTLEVTLPDGAVVRCDDLGSSRVQVRPLCAHRFDRAGPTRVQVQVVYRVSWQHSTSGSALESDLNTGDASAVNDQVLDVGEVQTTVGG